MIRWFIRKSFIDENVDEMFYIRVNRRMDVLLARDFLNKWNLDVPVDEPVMQRMYVMGRGFVEKDVYMEVLEHGIT